MKMSSKMRGGGPKKKVFKWTSEAKDLLIKIAYALDRNSKEFQATLFREFKREIEKIVGKNNGPKSIGAVATQLSTLEDQRPVKDRVNFKWTEEAKQKLLGIGLEMQARKARNHSLPFVKMMSDAFKRLYPDYTATEDNLRHQFFKIAGEREPDTVDEMRDRIEVILTEEDLSKARDSDNNLPDIVKIRQYYETGQRLGKEHLFKALCCMCGKLLFGDHKQNGRWLIVPGNPNQAYRYPVEVYCEELPPELPFKQGTKVAMCKVCHSRRQKKDKSERTLKPMPSVVNFTNPETGKWNHPKVLADIDNDRMRGMVSLLGVYHNVDVRRDEYHRRFDHIQGEVNLLSKEEQAYKYMFGLLCGRVDMRRQRETRKQEEMKVRKALTWLRKNNPLFKRFFANCETVFPALSKGEQTMIAPPDTIRTTRGDDMSEEMGAEERGYFIPANQFPCDDFTEDDYIRPVAHPSTPIGSAEDFKRMTRPGLFNRNLEAMAFPCDFPGGEGSYDPKADLSHRDYCKYLLLHIMEQFRKNPLLIFFMVDRYIKMSMIQNARAVIAPTGKKAVEKPTAGDLSDPRHDVYKRYGTRVAANIPGSKSYWWKAQQEVLAICIELKRPPDYFVTFTTNDNWPEIQSLLVPDHKPGQYCPMCPHKDERIPAVDQPVLCSIAFHQRFLRWKKEVIQNPNGELGKVQFDWYRREYQKRGAVHIHGLIWVDPQTKKNNVIRAEMPRTTNPKDKEFVEIQRALVEKYQTHHCVEDRCKMRGTKRLTQCKYGFPAPLVNEVRPDYTGLRKLYIRRKPEDQRIVPYCFSMLNIFDSCTNIQEVTFDGFEMYLTKYVCKPEKSTKVPYRSMVSKDATVVERYLRLRVMGIIEAIDIILQFPMKMSSVEVIYLDVPIHKDSQIKVLRQKKHLPRDPASTNVYYFTKFEKYLQRPSALKNVTYPDYFRQFALPRFTETTETTEEEFEPEIEEPEEPDDNSSNFIDKKNRRIHRRRRNAIIRWPFIMPYGDEIEKYCLKLLLEKVPVDNTTWDVDGDAREFKADTYLQECVNRNLWDKEEIGMEFLEYSRKMGYSEYDLRAIAGILMEGNYISHQHFREFWESHHLNDIFANPNNPALIDAIYDDPEYGPYPVPRMELESLESYIEKFTEDQAKIFEKIRHDIANDKQILCTVIGPAGTGKSHLIKAICALCRDKKDEKTWKSFCVLAPTGAAAFQIRGRTIHSMFKFDTKYKSHIYPSTMEAWLIRFCDIWIIDEMSMIDEYLMDEIELNIRKHVFHYDQTTRFGGKHIILVGDPAQLPSRNKPWFSGEHFKHFTTFTLKTLVRQKEDVFGAMLNKVRIGDMTPDVVQYFKKRLIKELDYDEVLKKNLTVIVSKRKQVDEINNIILGKLKGQLYTFYAEDTDLKGGPLSEQQLERLKKKDEKMADCIQIKVNALVHIRRNINVASGLVNGRPAIVESIHEESNIIILKSLDDDPQFWPITRQRQTIDDFGENRYVRHQFPITLGWASTVHRIQGQTLDNAIVQVDNEFFDSGQAYVALTRTRRIEDLTLLAFEPSRVFLSPYYRELLKWIENNDYFNENPDFDYPLPVWTRLDKYPDPREKEDIGDERAGDDIATQKTSKKKSKTKITVATPEPKKKLTTIITVATPESETESQRYHLHSDTEDEYYYSENEDDEPSPPPSPKSDSLTPHSKYHLNSDTDEDMPSEDENKTPIPSKQSLRSPSPITPRKRLANELSQMGLKDRPKAPPVPSKPPQIEFNEPSTSRAQPMSPLPSPLPSPVPSPLETNPKIQEIKKNPDGLF